MSDEKEKKPKDKRIYNTNADFKPTSTDEISFDFMVNYLKEYGNKEDSEWFIELLSEKGNNGKPLSTYHKNRRFAERFFPDILKKSTPGRKKTQLDIARELQQYIIARDAEKK